MTLILNPISKKNTLFETDFVESSNIWRIGNNLERGKSIKILKGLWWGRNREIVNKVREQKK